MGDIKCELIGGGSPRYLNTFSNLFIVGCTLHTSTPTMYCCYVLLLLLTLPMYAMLSKISEHTIPVVIVDCLCRVSYSSFEDLVTLHRRTLQQIF